MVIQYSKALTVLSIPRDLSYEKQWKMDQNVHQKTFWEEALEDSYNKTIIVFLKTFIFSSTNHPLNSVFSANCCTSYFWF